MKIKRLLVSLTLGLGMTLAFLWLLTAGSMTLVHADTYTVTNTNASGTGSLRQAIIDANGNPGHDTIDFGITGTIVLTDALPGIGDDLTISGPGVEQLAVSGANAYRVFSITTGIAVTITEVTVRDGKVINGDGGGIWSAGALHLDSVQIVSNTASGSLWPFGMGGGLYVFQGSATLSGTQVLGNSVSRYGGGVFVYDGSATLNETQVVSNSAFDSGGGMFVLYGSAMLNGTRVGRNSASYDGGGVLVYAGGATLSINGGEIDSNLAGSGGGVYVEEGSATLNGTQVDSNSATWGGGGVFVNEGNATLTDTQVVGNSADRGGGVSAEGGSTTLNETQVVSNLASSNGGGVYVDYDGTTLNVNGGEISNNSASDDGGGVYVYLGNATLSGTRVVSNSAYHGGGVSIRYGSATLSGTQVASNLSGQNGGGVYVLGGSVTLSQVQVTGNSAVWGGGVYNSSGSATLNETQVVGNSAFIGGGGVYVYGSSTTLNVSGGVIESNSASSDGGGVLVWYGTVTLSGTLVAGNSTSGWGGGISLWSGSMTLNETQVISNSVSNSGGGVYVQHDSATLNVNNGRIDNNSASRYGGGVYVQYGSVTLNGTQVVRNSAYYYSGGGVFVDQGSATLNGTQVDSNSARHGGGVYVDESNATLNVSGGRIGRNSASFGGGGVYIYEGSATLSGTQVVSNSTFFYSGGGVYVYQGSVTLSGTQIAANDAPNGSALYTEGTITPTTVLTVTGDVYQAGGRFAGSNRDLRIEGALVLAGGDFYAPNTPNDFVLTGPFSHTGGTYHQTQVVTGSSDVGFPKAGGVILNANNRDLNSTEVALTAGADCTGMTFGEAVAHEAVAHCYVITPTITTATIFLKPDTVVTFYYNDSEIPTNQACAAMEAFRWDSTWNNLLTRDSSYGSGGRMCGGDPLSIRVTGVMTFSPFVLRGLAPEITVLPPSLLFDQDVDAGATVSQMVTISNDGSVDLHISAVTPTGDTGEFNLVDSGEITLTSDSTRTIEVSFDPSSVSTKVVTLTIQSDDSDESTVNVTFIGIGVDQEISVVPTSLLFGDQDLNAGPTLSQVVVITNDGSADLHISAVIPTGDTSEFNLVDSGAITLTPGSTRAIEVSFDPSSMGAKAVTLTIQSDDSDESAVNVILTGMGTVAPEITVNPLSLSFGDQDVDAGATVSQIVTITNDGSVDLHVTGISLIGGDALHFQIENGSNAVTLTQGSTHTVQVSFDPSTTGARSASLSIQSDDGDESTVYVALIGTGTSAAVTYTLTVSKDGTGNGTGSSTPAGINCGTVCQANFAEGTVVTLTATPDTGFTFVGWAGEGCSGTGVCQVTMDATRQVTATFNIAAGYPGYGSDPAPASPINVGTANVGSTVNATLTISETGEATLVVTPTLSGPDAADFDFAPDTLMILDGGAAQDLTISCTPSVTRTLAATLTVAHNALGSPAVYALSCSGGTLRYVYLPVVVRNE